ncbi:MAG: outer membrane protein assembly factor BamE [Pseudomonadota bacterium]
MKNLLTPRVNHFALLFVSLFAIACTPTQSNRGNMVEEFRKSELVEGISTRQNVLRSLGSPTTTAPFDDNTWYYIGQKMEQKGIFTPEVTEEKIVVATFDEEGILQTLEEIDRDRLEVPVVGRTTPTGGNEISAVEQILGNVGRFNRSQSQQQVTPGL